MSRLTIDITEEQHRSLKALAAMEGKTIRQYALERLFPPRLSFPEDEAYEKAVAEGRRIITVGDLLDKPEAEMDADERAAWREFGAMLAERVGQARRGEFVDETVDEIWEQVLREEEAVSR